MLSENEKFRFPTNLLQFVLSSVPQLYILNNFRLQPFCTASDSMQPSTRVVLLLICLQAVATEARIPWGKLSLARLLRAPTYLKLRSPAVDTAAAAPDVTVLNLEPDLEGPHSFSALSNLIKRLPKAELHVHIEGTLDTDLMFELVKLTVCLFTAQLLPVPVHSGC